MKKLIVYGDSYAQEQQDSSLSWVSLLAAKLDLPLINRAIGGSSIEYSIKTFIKDKISKILEPDDIIIFVVTSPGRQHLKYQVKYPSTASVFRYETFTHKYPIEHINYYNLNKNYIKWFEDNKDEDIFKLNALSYVHMLNNYARNNPTNTFVVLSMSGLLNVIDIPILDNFIIPNISLKKISDDEFKYPVNFNYFTKKVKIDPRYNHLTIPNLHILTDLIYNSIINKDYSNIRSDKFIKNILDRLFLTEKDYAYFIKKGLLKYNQGVMDILLGV
jgi:hypothetical protein